MAEVAGACLVSQEVVRPQTLEHTERIVEPAASHLVLRSYTQRSSKQSELTGIESHHVLALTSALRSLRALSTILSPAVSPLAAHPGQPLKSANL